MHTVFTEKWVGEGESPSMKGEGASLSQLEIFQLILQKQCDAMVSLGVDPSIKVSTVLKGHRFIMMMPSTVLCVFI